MRYIGFRDHVGIWIMSWDGKKLSLVPKVDTLHALRVEWVMQMWWKGGRCRLNADKYVCIANTTWNKLQASGG